MIPRSFLVPWRPTGHRWLVWLVCDEDVWSLIKVWLCLVPMMRSQPEAACRKDVIGPSTL